MYTTPGRGGELSTDPTRARQRWLGSQQSRECTPDATLNAARTLFLRWLDLPISRGSMAFSATQKPEEPDLLLRETAMCLFCES